MSDNVSGSPSLDEAESRQDRVALKVVHLLAFSPSSERRKAGWGAGRGWGKTVFRARADPCNGRKSNCAG